MAFCETCAERGRPNVPAEREVGGTPMCRACIGGGKGGGVGFPAPAFERIPARPQYVRDWQRLFREVAGLKQDEDLAVHPHPGQTIKALLQSTKRKADELGIEICVKKYRGEEFVRITRVIEVPC